MTHRRSGQLARSVAPRSAARRAPRRFRNAFAFLLMALSLGLAAHPAVAAGDGSLVDLNRATAEQLEALPGIGEVKAAAILAVRAERGGFKSVEELESVRGIGAALVGKLRPMVKVGPPRAGRTAQAAAR